jgi:hypothetical protein
MIVMPFKPGHAKFGGRGTGSKNKIARQLKEAVITAAELEGYNGEGQDKLIGFLRMVARRDLRSFCALLGRIIPVQVQEEQTRDVRVEVTYRSIDEVRNELESRGISIDVVHSLLYQPPEIIDVEAQEVEEVEDAQG